MSTNLFKIQTFKIHALHTVKIHVFTQILYITTIIIKTISFYLNFESKMGKITIINDKKNNNNGEIQPRIS